MKILFIKPRPSQDTIGLQHVMLVEPLELEVMATLIKEKNDVKIIDLIIEKKDFNYFLISEKPDVLCFTGYITDIPAIKYYCDTAKKFSEDIITIVGGVHCEVCPEDFDHYSVDYRVIRNAVISFPVLISFINNKTCFPEGVLKRNDTINQAKLPDFNFDFPIADRSLTKRYRYKYFYIFHNKIALIKTAFGCPYKCSFCFCRRITDDIYIKRPIRDVIDELKGIKEKEIYIVDDDFLCEKKRVLEFIETVKKANIYKKYLIYSRADFIADNPDIVRQFKDIGLKTVIIGFESFNDDELKFYKKNTNSSINFKAMEILNRNKIDCFATIIINPLWDDNDFKNIQNTLKQIKIHYINLQPLTPLPETGLFVERKKLLISHDDYTKWDLAHVAIKPEKISIKRFYENIIKTYEVILFQPKYLLLYLFKYPPVSLFRMVLGVIKVRIQYMNKLKEFKNV
ncbi:MAG: cobalamin-dependent protein [Spirochaetes bacterium]|nr:cobalamin-dependent protein [Spirochaetota bacterium]